MYTQGLDEKACEKKMVYVYEKHRMPCCKQNLMLDLLDFFTGIQKVTAGFARQWREDRR